MEESVRSLNEYSIYTIHHSTYYESKRGATGWCRAKPPKEDGGAFAGCTAVNSRNASGNFFVMLGFYPNLLCNFFVRCNITLDCNLKLFKFAVKRFFNLFLFYFKIISNILIFNQILFVIFLLAFLIIIPHSFNYCCLHFQCARVHTMYGQLLGNSIPVHVKIIF